MPASVQKRIILDTDKRGIVQFNFLNTGTLGATGGLSASLGVTSDFINALSGQNQTLSIARVLYSIPSAAVYSINFGISGGVLGSATGSTQGVFLNGGAGTELNFYNSGFAISNPLGITQQSRSGYIFIQNETSVPADSFSTITVEFTKTGYRGYSL